MFNSGPIEPHPLWATPATHGFRYGEILSAACPNSEAGNDTGVLLLATRSAERAGIRAVRVLTLDARASCPAHSQCSLPSAATSRVVTPRWGSPPDPLDALAEATLTANRKGGRASLRVAVAEMRRLADTEIRWSALSTCGRLSSATGPGLGRRGCTPSALTCQRVTTANRASGVRHLPRRSVARW